jgi:hypothetical protein
MATSTQPIDYAAIRVGLVRAIQWATPLDQDHVIMSEPEVANAPRPSLPYMTLKIITSAIRFGDDVAAHVSELGETSTVYNYGGQREMVVSFNVYGRTHEEAYGLAALWQARLDQIPTQTLLRQSGLAVWLIGEVRDLSMLLATGFEGRAQLDCRMGLASNLTADLGRMEEFDIQGTAEEDPIA